MKFAKVKQPSVCDIAEMPSMSDLTEPSDICGQKRRKKKCSPCKKTKPKHKSAQQIKKLIAKLKKQKSDKKKEVAKVVACLDQKICILTNKIKNMKKTKAKNKCKKAAPQKKGSNCSSSGDK